MKPDMLNERDRERLRAAVESILKVYTIPVVLKKVLEVVEDERSSVNDLVEVVQRDQALASKIVATANTAFYGFRRNISSIPGAAVTLGLNMVRSLAVSVSVFRDCSGDMEFLKDLWKHSFEVALASSFIAERTGIAKKEDAFLAGLIHDLGRAILYQIHDRKYVKLSLECGDEDLSESETGAFGASHAQVGAWFVDKYRFPKDCVLAIEFHHEPEKSGSSGGAFYLSSIVHIADRVITGKNEKKEEGSVPEELSSVMRSIYLDAEGLNEIKERLAEMEDVIRDFYAR